MENIEDKSQVYSLLNKIREFAIKADRGAGINALEDFKEIEAEYLVLVDEIDRLTAKMTGK